ncbi:hypothetical protein [Niallia sp. Krafla_26]
MRWKAEGLGDMKIATLYHFRFSFVSTSSGIEKMKWWLKKLSDS